VERMGKYFGRTARIGEMRVSAITKKPRELYMPGGEQVSLGLPVFTVGGEVVGVGIMQSPASDDTGDNAVDMSDMSDSVGSLILPSEEVVKATARAKESGKADDGDKPKDDKPKKKNE